MEGGSVYYTGWSVKTCSPQNQFEAKALSLIKLHPLSATNDGFVPALPSWYRGTASPRLFNITLVDVARTKPVKTVVDFINLMNRAIEDRMKHQRRHDSNTFSYKAHKRYAETLMYAVSVVERELEYRIRKQMRQKRQNPERPILRELHADNWNDAAKNIA